MWMTSDSLNVLGRESKTYSEYSRQEWSRMRPKGEPFPEINNDREGFDRGNKTPDEWRHQINDRMYSALHAQLMTGGIPYVDPKELM